MTDFDSNVIISTGSIRPEIKDTPLDARCRIDTLSDIYNIPLPYVGMLVFCKSDAKYYKVTALGSDVSSPFPEPDAVVSSYEPFRGEGGTVSSTIEKPFVNMGSTPSSMVVNHDGNAVPYALYTLSDGGSGSTDGIILNISNVEDKAYGEILLKQTGRFSVYLGDWIMTDGTRKPLQGHILMEMNPGAATLLKWTRIDDNVFCNYEIMIPEDSVPVVSPIQGLQCLYVDSHLCHLTWISPETNNGQEGADQYDLRYSSSKLTPEELELKWSKLEKLQTPKPSLPGSPEFLTVNRLTADTSYYFYIKAIKVQSGRTYYSDLYAISGDYVESNGSYVKVRTNETLAFDDTHSYRKLQQIPLIEDQIFVLRPAAENILNPVQNALDNISILRVEEDGKPGVVPAFEKYWEFPAYQKDANPNYITIDLLNNFVFESMWFCVDKKVPSDAYKASSGSGITFYYKTKESSNEWVEFTSKMYANEVQTDHKTWVHVQFTAAELSPILDSGARFVRIGFDDYVYGVFNTTKLAYPAGCDDTSYTDIAVSGDLPSGLSGSTYAWEGSNPLQMEHIYAFVIYGYRTDDEMPDNILPPRRRNVKKYTVRDSFNNHGQAYYEGKLISTVSGNFTRFYMNLGDLTYLLDSTFKPAVPFNMLDKTEANDIKSKVLSWADRSLIIGNNLSNRREVIKNIKINLDTYNWITDQASWKYFGKNDQGIGIYGKARTMADSFQWNLIRYGVKPYLAPVGLPLFLRHYHHTWQNSKGIGFPLDQYWAFAATSGQYSNGFPLPKQAWRGWADLQEFAHNPVNFGIMAKVAFSVVAKLGSKDWSDNQEILDYIFPTPGQLEAICPGYTLHDTATGCNVISGIEYFNEPDGYADGVWMTKHDPTTMAASESAWNDGNQDTLKDHFGLDFYGFGTKNADPNIASIGSGCAGLAPGHLFEYFTFWLNNRTPQAEGSHLVQGICPLEIIKTHSYFSSGGSQFQEYASNATGVSVTRSKVNGTHKTIFDLEKLRDRYFPKASLWMSEFGWGEAGQCGAGADPSNNLVSQFQITTRMARLYYNDSASRKTQTMHRSLLKGCFAISGYIELMASGFQGCNYYMLESEDNSDSVGGMSDFFDAKYNPKQGWITGGPGYEMFHHNDIPDSIDRENFNGTYTNLDPTKNKFQYLKNNYQSMSIRPAFSSTGLCGSPLKMGFFPLTNAFWYVLTFRTHLSDYVFCGMKDIFTTVNGLTRLDEKIKCGCFKKIDSSGTEHGAYVLWYADCNAEELTANLNNYTFVDPYGGYVNDKSTGLPADLNSAMSYEAVNIEMPGNVDRVKRITYNKETLVPNPRQAPWNQTAYMYEGSYTPDPRYPGETIKVPLSRGSWNVGASWDETKNTVSYDQVNQSQKNRCNAIFTYSSGTKQSSDETVYGMVNRSRLILPTARRERALIASDGTVGRWENVNQRWGDNYDEIESFTLRQVAENEYHYEEFDIKDFASGEIKKYRERIVLPSFAENPYFPMVGPVHSYYGDHWPDDEGPRSNRYYPLYGTTGQFVTDNAYAWRQSDALADYAKYSEDAKVGREGIIADIARGGSESSDYYIKSQFTADRILKTDITIEPVIYLFDAVPQPSFNSRVENLTGVKNNSSSVSLWWNNNNPDDTFYNIYINREGTTGAFTELLAQIPAGAQNSYRVEGLDPSTTTKKASYAFAVCPVNEAGMEGKLSDPLVIEMGLSMSAALFSGHDAGFNKVVLNWEWEEANLFENTFSYYQIQRFSSGDSLGSVNVAHITDISQKQFVDTKGLVANTDYTYQIRVVCGTEKTEWTPLNVSTVGQTDSKAYIESGVYDGEKIILSSDIDLSSGTFASAPGFAVTEAAASVVVTSVKTGGKYIFLYCSLSKYSSYKSIRVSFTGGDQITTTYGKGLFTFSNLRVQNNYGRSVAHSYHVCFQYFKPEDIVLEWNSSTQTGTPEPTTNATAGVTWGDLSAALQRWCVVHARNANNISQLKEVTTGEDNAPVLASSNYFVTLATGSYTVNGNSYSSEWGDAEKYNDGQLYKYQETVNNPYSNLYKLGTTAETNAPEDLYAGGTLAADKANGFLYASRHACNGKWQGSESDSIVVVSGLKTNTRYRMKVFATGSTSDSYNYLFAGESLLGSGTVTPQKTSSEHGMGQWIAADWGNPDSSGNMYLVFPKVSGNGYSRFIAFMTLEEEQESQEIDMDSLDLRGLSVEEVVENANT